ncbi:serine/threonine protein kinase [Singulisphaera sp. GP187]|uniref:serine/threonine-protein kinase n=1 Tax=Singulisphaera sp. GP187 TaxID=1882752 RepID=UPI000926BC5A|nr:serine/threonine-protein kinase [Singulisphaera sp. GP187]SIO65498.1 serine/threonine protein kinase [Singulisphaera sp. GP187]
MPRLEDFLANLARSGLVPPSDLERARSSLPSEPTADAAVRLAKLLIQLNVLTPYQARKVLAGATRGFFLGGYRILRPIGEGGMGKVFLAAREGKSQRVAIKVLPPKKAAEEGQALLRFRREMELSRRANHPNLARTLDVGSEGDVHFMVLEYIPGDSLYHTVKGKSGGPLRVPDTARFFLKVLDGLEAAHNSGLIHRDIKPSNIMVTPDGDARILDLGLAKAINEESPLTRPNVVIGTLDYASPEQLGNAAQADRRSDLYSLGCTLYFTLSGRAPFEGGDVVNKIFKQRMEDPEPLERVARGVPAAFAAIVRKLMAKSPDDRYQTCAELSSDLARWTDPEKVRSILGAEAESARAFRPPPPELEDEDLRLLTVDDSQSSQPFSLRDLGEAEPAFAPMHRPPPSPVPAVVLLPGERERRVAANQAYAPASRIPPDESRWLVHFVAIAVVIGVLAILGITLLR